MKQIITFSIGLLATMLVLQGCSSSTQLTNSWASQESGNNSTAPAPVKKVMVLAMFNNASNMALRSNLEKELVRDLKAYNVDAVGALQTYGPKAFQGLTENQALSKLQADGVEAVLTVRLLDKNKERSYVPGRMGYAPYPYGGWWGYYSYYSPMMYQPGYYATSTSYSFESNLYNVNNGQLLYSAQSQAFDPSSAKNLADDYARMIVKDLRKKRAIGK